MDSIMGFSTSVAVLSTDHPWLPSKAPTEKNRFPYEVNIRLYEAVAVKVVLIRIA